MITEDNFAKVLLAHNFTYNQELNRYYKSFGTANNRYEMIADFNTKKLEYAKGIKFGRATTQDFHQNENFVVFECVCRLLEIGYEPTNIELEATSGVAGRGQTQTYLDILVKDNHDNNYLIVECKTAGKEFEDAWKKVKKNGGQLFNYWTLFGTRHLCLYSSDLIADKLTYSSNIIIFEKEDLIQDKNIKNKKLAHIEALQKTNSLIKGYKDLDDCSTQNDYFNVWTDTYNQPEVYYGIFEDNCKPFEISEKITLAYKDLKEIENYEDMQSKYNQFATILRQHNVGSRENSFDKLVNLFLAKIVDETDNQKDLKFNWKGAAFDDFYNFQDRLQQMYSKGMSEFLGEKVEYVSDEQIDKAFKFFTKDTPELSRDEVKKLFHIQKFFTNNDFSFLDVHNEQLFMQNIAILIKVVQLLQGIKLKTDKENQFLGDLFEGFLDQGVKQSEGQFFTPTPIVKFLVSSLPLSEMVDTSIEPLKVIDYACGAGHFLNEAGRVLKSEVQQHKKDFNDQEIFKNIVGIEKEYRLSKVSKVSAFMYSQNDIQIVYGDGLVPHSNVQNNTFDILIANPPYSVKGFLETLDNNAKNLFSLYQNRAKTINESTTNSIETFFVERASQLLSAKGIAAIILPSSILSNSNIYTDCRKIILENFNVIAISEFGSGTFGKTGTNTVTLFLEKKAFGKHAEEKHSSDEAIQYRNRVNAWFNGNFSKDEFFEDGHFFEEYCELINTDFCEYQNWILRKDLPKSDLFNKYAEDLKKVLKDVYSKKLSSKYTQKDQENEIKLKSFNYISSIEKEKMYYFILSKLNRTKVIIAKSPTSNTDIKQYLGYEWSGTKGKEGIKYIGVKSDEDSISKNSGVLGIMTPLFNPIDRNDTSKICFAIRKNFVDPDNIENICNSINLPEGASLEILNLSDMIDFSRTSFDMEIKTNVKKKEVEIKYKEGIKTVRLGDIATINPSKSELSKYSDNTMVSFVEMASVTNDGVIREKIDRPLKELRKGSYTYFAENDVIIAKITPCMENGKCALATNLTNGIALGSSEFHVIRGNNGCKSEYIYYFLNREVIRKLAAENMTGSSGHRRVPESFYSQFIIPLPSKEVQERIVSQCQKLDMEANEAKENVKILENQIIDIIEQANGKKLRLGEICNSNIGLTYKPENIVGSEGTIVLRASNIQNGQLDFVDTVRVNCKIPNKCFVNNGDVLICVRSGSKNLLGKSAYISDITEPMAFGAFMSVCRSQYNKWIYYWMKSSEYRNQINNLTATMSINQLTQKALLDLQITLPSIKEQNKIISHIEKLEKQIKDLRSIIDSVQDEKNEIIKNELLA